MYPKRRGAGLPCPLTVSPTLPQTAREGWGNPAWHSKVRGKQKMILEGDIPSQRGRAASPSPLTSLIAVAPPFPRTLREGG